MASPRIRTSLPVAATALLLALSACGGGGGSNNGNLSQDAGKDLGTYEVVDLNTGTLQSQDSIPDLLTNPVYRTTSMVFRALPSGTAVSGQAAGTFGAQVDEAPDTITVTRFYIGVFDVTQQQWTLIAGAGSTPWTDPAALAVAGAGSVNPLKPAFGLSRDAVLSGLAAEQARVPFPATLPDDAQWEYACRAGATTVFSWGDLGATPAASAGPYALVQETSAGLLGPATVGSLAPNAFGLYDMLGNVWQWTSTGSGEIRGGSWRDSLAQARCANKVPLDHTISHVLVGVRLVLIP